MSKPLTVVILSSMFLPTVGGVQFELKWLLDNLDYRLHSGDELDLHFIYPNSDSEEYARFAIYLPISCHSGPPTKPLPLGDRQAWKAAQEDWSRCSSLLWWSGAGWIVGRLGASPIWAEGKNVVTSHGLDIAWLPHIAYGIRRSAKARVLIREVARRVDRHVLVSRAMIDFAVDAGTARDKIKVIPNGIPYNGEYNFEEQPDHVFYSIERDNFELRCSDGINVLCLSSGREMKNLDALVEAFYLARHELGRLQTDLGLRRSAS